MRLNAPGDFAAGDLAFLVGVAAGCFASAFPSSAATTCLNPSLPPATLAVAWTSLAPLRRFGAVTLTSILAPEPLRTRSEAAAAPPGPVSVSTCVSSAPSASRYELAKCLPAPVALQWGRLGTPARQASRSKYSGERRTEVAQMTTSAS